MNRLFVVLLLMCGSVSAQNLWLDPSEIEIRRLDNSTSVRLTFNGTPVAADAVSRIKLYVNRHDYDEMFDTEIEDGKITFTPTSLMEIGRYDLVIDTRHGTVRGVIRVTLQDDLTLLENRARELDMSVDAMRRMLGLVQTGRDTLRVDISPSYVLGQSFHLALEPPAEREYIWIFNGSVVKYGSGPHQIRYLFREPGAYTIQYQERDSGKLVNDLSIHTEVREEAAIPWEVPVRQQVYVAAPEGFEDYLWRLDGERIASASTLTYIFEKAGSYTLECIASSPEPDPKYRKITYVVAVE
jgi:hypothetical protein